MFKRLVFSVLLCPVNAFGQNISGVVVDEDQNPLSGVTVFNLRTENKVFTNLKGEFNVACSPKDELRFIREGYERSTKIISLENYGHILKVSLLRSASEIEEVRIQRQITGNLNKDIDAFGDNKALVKLKTETVKYIKSKSSLEVLAAKPGEFVQPQGPGFSIGAPNSKWDDIDFMEYLLANIEESFFTNELRLKPTELQPFVYYIFKNFPRNEILFYGICSPYDLSRFIGESYNKIENYKKNLPNNAPDIKKKK